MGRTKVGVALLLLVLILGAKQVQSEEILSKSDLSNPKIASGIDVDELKNALKNVSSTSDANNVPLKAKIKTLGTKYLFGPGDTFAISVYGEPEFTQPEILVRPDGFATIEPFGEVNVAGSSIDELTANLKGMFKSYLLDPKISIKVNNLNNGKVYIYGAVQKPGLYQQATIMNKDPLSNKSIMTSPAMTVASIISNAGGIQFNADLQHVKVTNNESGRDEEVDLMGMLKNGDVSQDIYLRSGDTIYVPKIQSDAQISDRDFILMASSSVAPPDFPVKVIGYVTKPGVYDLKSSSATLNSAIASAEGYTVESNRKVVEVQRTTPQGNISKLFIDPSKNDIVLRPNDLIIVSDKSTAVATRGLTMVSNILSPLAILGSGVNGWVEIFDPNRYNYRP